MAIADIYKKATLVQIPSGYKSGTLYSVVPNTADGDFTVSADADATRVNKDGLIESTFANQARLNYNFIDGVVQPDPHLLLEPTRTNSTTYSEDFTQTSYWGNVVDVVATTNQITAPDGSNTGNKIQANSGTNFKILRTGAFTIPSGITMSMFVKRGNHDYIIFKAQGDFNFNLSTLTWGGSYSNVGYELYPNDWVRLYATTSSSVLSYFGIYLTDSSFNQSWNATGDEFVYVWGAQYETGSYPTSYIPTSGTAVTRSVDTCGTSDTNLINNTEGVLFVDFEFSEQGTTSLYQIATGLFNSGGSGTQTITIDNYSGKLRIYVVSPSGTRTVWDTSKSISNVVANQRYRVAIRYKNGDCASYVNGELYKADSGSVSGFDLVKMVFGYANFGNTLMHRGKIYQAMYFNTSLLNSELEEITSYKSFGQMAKALLYTIE